MRILLSQMSWWCRWVSADWLKQWADQGATEPVKNDPLLCPHGKLDPAKVTGQLQLPTRSLPVLSALPYSL